MSLLLLFGGAAQVPKGLTADLVDELLAAATDREVDHLAGLALGLTKAVQGALSVEEIVRRARLFWDDLSDGENAMLTALLDAVRPETQTTVNVAVNVVLAAPERERIGTSRSTQPATYRGCCRARPRGGYVRVSGGRCNRYGAACGDAVDTRHADHDGRRRAGLTMLGTYACAVCGRVFDKERRGGRLPSVCSPECKAEQNRRRAAAWYAANPDRAAAYRLANQEAIRAYNRAYYQRDPARHIARSLRWQQRNPEGWAAIRKRQKDSGADAARARRFRAANPEVIRARNLADYWADPERGRRRAATWVKANPDKARARDARNNRRRKAVIRGAAIGERFEIVDVFERDGWMCQLCGEPIDPTLRSPHRLSATIDHVLPIRRGGAHTLANVQAAHYGCNASKGDRG
jgi:5-methylcytosine-specific restriction endonuclease McrA